MDKPLLHLVFGGAVSDPQWKYFVDRDNLDIIWIILTTHWHKQHDKVQAKLM
jgi:hypothetical protein